MSENNVTVHRVNNASHRVNGPAVLFNNSEWDWYLFGKWHRYYGPSDSSGNWFIHNVRVKCIEWVGLDID